MNDRTSNIIKWTIIIKWVIVLVVLGMVYQQATARAKNIGRAEEGVAQAQIQDSIVDVLQGVADVATARAELAELESVQRAALDSAIIGELRDSVTDLSAVNDSIGDDIEESLAGIDADLAASFKQFRVNADATLAASQEETRVERESKEDAERRVLLWQNSSLEKDPIIDAQALQIQQLNGAVGAALAAANPGLWPRIQADWWVGAIGFGIGIIATR